jgi:hypothetical protein
MNATSPLVSFSRHYKIAAEFLEAEIPDLGEKYRPEQYLGEIHPRETSVIEMMGATIDLPATDIILHLIDSPVERLVFTGKFPLVSGTNRASRANIDNDRCDAENHRCTSPNAMLNAIHNPSDPSLKYESGRPFSMRRGQYQRAQHQPVQGLTAAIRGCA